MAVASNLPRNINILEIRCASSLVLFYVCLSYNQP